MAFALRKLAEEHGLPNTFYLADMEEKAGRIGPIAGKVLRNYRRRLFLAINEEKGRELLDADRTCFKALLRTEKPCGVYVPGGPFFLQLFNLTPCPGTSGLGASGGSAPARAGGRRQS